MELIHVPPCWFFTLFAVAIAVRSMVRHLVLQVHLLTCFVTTLVASIMQQLLFGLQGLQHGWPGEFQGGTKNISEVFVVRYS